MLCIMFFCVWLFILRKLSELNWIEKSDFFRTSVLSGFRALLTLLYWRCSYHRRTDFSFDALLTWHIMSFIFVRIDFYHNIVSLQFSVIVLNLRTITEPNLNLHNVQYLYFLSGLVQYPSPWLPIRARMPLSNSEILRALAQYDRQPFLSSIPSCCVSGQVVYPDKSSISRTFPSNIS